MSVNNIKDIRRLAYIENTIIAALVVVMMGIYYAIGAMFLVYYSIFVAIVYLVHYFFIRRFKFIPVTWSTYTMLTLYMSICTVYLGFDYGFFLYSMSTIPLIYYIKYLTTKFGGKDPKPNFWAIFITLCCVLSSLYSIKHGPIYPTEQAPALLFLGLNLASVCFFLITFSQLTIKIILGNEEKLKRQADYDALTGLANRYHMMTCLEKIVEESKESSQLWVAMIDVDDFKQINDKYGHATGDRVLGRLSSIMKKHCANCTISRWGGEEFLICGKADIVSPRILEDLVKQVGEATVSAQNEKVHFTISAGVATYVPGQDIDAWIINADKMLYKVKNSGKNNVAF
ncbi:MAG: GGDEF domain-containing protein [Fibrobacter sp.]|nr:GGDEF domain-containing protein [Fibrobacter sp.]